MADDHTISADAPPAISLEAAVALTGRSRRTWWRRIEEGAVAKLAPDARGRALLVFDEVRPAIGLALDDEDMAAILRADGGDAQAQAQVGALFALAALKEEASSSPLSLPAGEIAPKSRGGGQRYAAATYWLQLAAAQKNADAMHWLGILHAAGHGGDDHEHLALMWIAKAAAHGHMIARSQLAALRRG